jgi:hypothetical protein
MKPLYNRLERVDGDKSVTIQMAQWPLTIIHLGHRNTCASVLLQQLQSQESNVLILAEKIYTCNYISGSKHHELFEVDLCIYFTTTRQDVIMISSALDNVIKNTIVFNKTGLCK